MIHITFDTLTILEFQHVERTDKSDFYFYCHEINLLPLEDL